MFKYWDEEHSIWKPIVKRDPTLSASEGSQRDAGTKLILTKLATGGDRRSTSRTLESNSLKGYGAQDAIQYLSVLLSSHDCLL